ncbi:MAG: hypothetical protein R6V04_11800 [bacterium]
MVNKRKNRTFSAAKYASKVFEAKHRYHKNQAQLPIEKKIKILIELQKMVINIQNNPDNDKSKFVWKIK